jgi:hypothetical protein
VSWQIFYRALAWERDGYASGGRPAALGAVFGYSFRGKRTVVLDGMHSPRWVPRGVEAAWQKDGALQ